MKLGPNAVNASGEEGKKPRWTASSQARLLQLDWLLILTVFFPKTLEASVSKSPGSSKEDAVDSSSGLTCPKVHQKQSIWNDSNQ